MAVVNKYKLNLNDKEGTSVKDKPNTSTSNASNLGSNSSASNNNQTVSTPRVSNSSSRNNTYQTYSDLLSKYNSDKSNISSDSSLADNQTDSLNQKISATTELLEAYKNNSLDTQSAKAQSELAQQNASSATKAYMEAVGLGGQGVSESSQVALNNNYANAQNNINLAQNQNNASARDTYNNAINNIDLQEQSNNKDTQANNYQALANGMASSVGSDGSINADILNTYKEQADKMLSSGEITQSAYNDILATYKQAISDYDTANNQTTSAVNSVLGALGVTDYNPIKNGNTELTKSDTNSLRDYLIGNYEFSDEGALQRSLNALLGAEEGTVVEIEDKTNGVASFVCVNGKFYQVSDEGKKSANSNTNTSNKGQGASSGDGTAFKPYTYGSVSDLNNAIKSGAVQVGDYVIYTDNNGKIVRKLITSANGI